MSDSMEIDEYSRDRSRSPRRDEPRRRSRSPGRRDDRSRRGDDRGRHERGGRGGRGRGGRGGRGGDRGEYRRPYQDRDSYQSRYQSSSFRGPPRYQSDADRERDKERKIREYEIKNSRVHSNSVFVGNLPYGTDWRDLKDYFAEIGDIIRADIVTSHGKPRGMGTVEFSNKQAVFDAIKRFDRSDFKGREIFVREDLPPPEKQEDSRRGDSYRDQQYPPREREYNRYDDSRDSRDSRHPRDRDSYRNPPPPKREFYPEPAPEGCEVFVGNLPFRTDTRDLKEIFGEVGPVARAEVRLDPRGRSKGFGTVVFESAEIATVAIERFNGYELDGRKIDVREGKVYGKKPDEKSLNTEFTEGVSGEGEPSSIIFVTNLPWETSTTDLYELFESISPVSKAELKFDSLGRPSGSGVVQFAEEEGAAGAIAQLDNYEYGKRNLKISYAKFPVAAPKVTPSGPASFNQDVAPAAPVSEESSAQETYDAVAAPSAPVEDVDVVDAPIEQAAEVAAPAAPVEEYTESADIDVDAAVEDVIEE